MKKFFWCALFLFLALPAWARQTVSLNGTWQMVKATSLDAAPQEGWADFEVPGTIGGYKGEFAWFKRSFDAPENWRGQRVHLQFGGVKWNSKIFVNDQLAGGKLNGYDAFEIDITPLLKFGAANELRIGVQDWTATFSPGEPVDLSNANSSFSARGLPKNRVISPFGGHNGNYGIWDDVSLCVMPPVHVENVFIKPSVRSKSLKVEWVFNNESGTPYAGPLMARILNYEGGGRDATGQWTAGRLVKNLELAGPLITTGERFPLSYSADNLSLETWTPQNPKLYILEIQIGEGANADIYRERFGFREFWTQGGAFYLNGAKTHLLATSWWPNALKPLSNDDIKKQLNAIRKANTFTFRTHTQPWPERWYELADEIGVMMIPEGAMWCDSQVYAVDDERFWKNYGDHLVAMANHLHNHASVIMYSLENEMGHCGGKDNPKMEAGFARMAKLIKTADPTHPITFEADGDPGGATDVIGIHYPNEYPQKRLWPNDAYWLNEPRKLSLFGPQPWLWKHDKPIYIGEYLWVYNNATPAAHTIFFGDEAYRDHKIYSAKAKSEAWKMQIQAYRAQDVSGQSPWTMMENGPLDESNPTYRAHQDKYRPLAAFIKEYDSHFWAGETITRTVQLFNDTLKDEPMTQVAWTLFEGAQQLSSGARLVNLSAGGIKEEQFDIPMPTAKAWRYLTLRLQILTHGTERFHESWPMQVVTRPDKFRLGPFIPLERQQVASYLHTPPQFYVFDPQGALKTAWAKGGQKFASLNKLDNWNGTGVLVIGPAPEGKKIEPDVNEADLQPLAKKEDDVKAETQIIGGISGGQKLWDKVKNGGRVLLFEQNAADWLPVRLSEQSSTMTFPLVQQHPLLQSITVNDLRWWRGDNLVSRNEPARGAQVGFKPYIVTGDENGISHAPLLQIDYGKGAWLICQMQAISKMESEPTARRLLQNVITYFAITPNAQVATAVFASPELKEKLARLGLDSTSLNNWTELKFPQMQTLFLQADNATIAQNAKVLNDYMQAGGKVLWHRPSAENFDEAVKALNLKIERQNYRGPALRADVIPYEFQMLTREDLYWTGAPDSVAWNAAALATDTAEATFGEAPREIEGTNYSAKNAPVLAGQILRLDGDAVLFATNGSATWKVDFPQSQRYTVSVYARGTSYEDVFPQVALSLDGQPLGLINLTQKEARFYKVSFNGKAGAHELKAEFTNDKGNDKEDRNLWIDRFVIGEDNTPSIAQNLTNPAALVRYPIGKGALILSAIRWDEAGGNQGKANHFAASLLTALGGRNSGPSQGSIIETHKMNPMPNLTWYRREASGVYMGSAGYIEGPIEVQKAGKYHVEVWGKGTKGAGVYPIIVLELNGAEIDRVEIKSDDYAPHSLDVTLLQGKANLRLRFINDDAPAPEDRNLWLGRMEFMRADPLKRD